MLEITGKSNWNAFLKMYLGPLAASSASVRVGTVDPLVLGLQRSHPCHQKRVIRQISPQNPFLHLRTSQTLALTEDASCNTPKEGVLRSFLLIGRLLGVVFCGTHGPTPRHTELPKQCFWGQRSVVERWIWDFRGLKPDTEIVISDWYSKVRLPKVVIKLQVLKLKEKMVTNQIHCMRDVSQFHRCKYKK